ncbi:MAG: hypothetical protein ACKO63_20045, partial [Nodosilinea sp.]
MNSYEEYLAYIQSDEFDARTEHGKAVFYSGVLPESQIGNRKLAERFCADSGSCLIGNTIGGKWLQEITDRDINLSDKQTDSLWSAVSKKYAEQAVGDITAFVYGAEEKRIFYSAELPALLKNENITSINSVPRAELSDWYNNQKDPEITPELAMREIFREIADPLQIEQTVMKIYERNLPEQTQATQSQPEQPQASESPKQALATLQEREQPGPEQTQLKQEPVQPVQQPEPE